MSEKISTILTKLNKELSNDEYNLIVDYFNKLNEVITLDTVDKRGIINDLIDAINYYSDNNISIKEALERLDLSNFGDFYSNESNLWFNTDDVAKLYPQFMLEDSMGVFRVSMYLDEDIDVEILQIALLFTIKRFRQFAVVIKRGFFWHYLETVSMRYVVKVDKPIPCRPIDMAGSFSQTFNVTYFKNRISVEMFHGMTDGTGGMEFLKSLVKEYLVLKGYEIESSNILDINEEPNQEEYENAFRNIKFEKNKGKLFQKKALQIGSKLSKVKPCRVLHFKMSVSKVKEAVKKYNSTVTGYLMSLMFMACSKTIKETNGDVVLCIPVNLRKFFKTKTLRNFSLFSPIRKPINEITSIKDIIESVNTKLKENTSYEHMMDMLSSTVAITQKIGFIPLFLMSPVVKFSYNFVGDRQFTSSISNLGLVELPESMSKHVLSMDFILGTSISNRAVSAVVSVNDTLTLSITKLTTDELLENNLLELLNSDGIDVLVEGSEVYEY